MNKEKKTSSGIDLSRYKDSEGISLQKITFGLWLLNHRRHFFISIIILLFLVSVFFYSYSVYHYLDYFFGSGIKERQSLEEMTVNSVLISEEQRLKNIANPLTVEGAQAVKHVGKLDLWGVVENPNDNFSALFNYCFYFQEKEIFCGADFILPSQEKDILVLGLEDEFSGQASLVLKGIQWSRLDPRRVSDWEVYKKERLNFIISDFSFKDGQQSGLSDKKSLGVLDFKIKNNSAYGYWELPIDIILYSGSLISGLQRYMINEFRSGEERNVKIVWPDSLGAVNDYKIIPQVDILNDEIFIKYY